MFTLLFGLIRGFFKLIGGIISFIIGGILLLLVCFFLAKSCSEFTYDAYRMERETPHHIEHNCPQTYYQQQQRAYSAPKPQPCTPQRATNFQYNPNRFGDASYMFEEYHFIHQFNPGVMVACPVCHKQFYKNSVDNCFCSDACWHRYNDIVNAWNRGDRCEVEYLGKNFR